MNLDWLNILVTAFIGLTGALGGGGILYWGATRRLKAAEAQKSNTDAKSAEVDLADKILEKYEKTVLSHMESGEAVRKQEFESLAARFDKRFDVIEAEDRKQNEIIRDIAEYLNGGFKQFEIAKRRREARQAKKAKLQVEAQAK